MDPDIALALIDGVSFCDGRELKEETLRQCFSQLMVKDFYQNLQIALKCYEKNVYLLDREKDQMLLLKNAKSAIYLNSQLYTSN